MPKTLTWPRPVHQVPKPGHLSAQQITEELVKVWTRLEEMEENQAWSIQEKEEWVRLQCRERVLRDALNGACLT